MGWNSVPFKDQQWTITIQLSLHSAQTPGKRTARGSNKQTCQVSHIHTLYWHLDQCFNFCTVKKQDCSDQSRLSGYCWTDFLKEAPCETAKRGFHGKQLFLIVRCLWIVGESTPVTVKLAVQLQLTRLHFFGFTVCHKEILIARPKGTRLKSHDKVLTTWQGSHNCKWNWAPME